MGPLTIDIVGEIGKRMSKKSGEKKETWWLLQRLSIAVQRGNALSILSPARHMMGYG